MSEERWREDTWCRYLPCLHRQLADPQINSGLPRSFVSLNFEDTCAWWETLRYLFRSLLGWRSLPMGLAWWYESNLTDGGDPCLQLILDRWNTRKELDYFAAREWETRGFTGMPGDEAIDFDENYEPHPGWRRELQNRPPIEELSPWGGGYNPLHLGHSDTVGYEKSHEKPMIHLDPKSRRAFLVINNFGSWQRDLDEFGKKLPDLGNRSWHVEVFDRSIGYLGRYRKSRETGLWFQGKHSLHMAGNPPGGKGIGLPLDLPSHDSKKNTA